MLHADIEVSRAMEERVRGYASTAAYLFDGEAPRLARPSEVVVARVDPPLERAGHRRERELRPPPRQRLLLLRLPLPPRRLRGGRRSGSVPAAARSLLLRLPPPPRPPPPPLLLPPALVPVLLPFPLRRRGRLAGRRLGPGRLRDGLLLLGVPAAGAEEAAELDVERRRGEEEVEEDEARER